MLETCTNFYRSKNIFKIQQPKRFDVKNIILGNSNRNFYWEDFFVKIDFQRDIKRQLKNCAYFSLIHTKKQVYFPGDIDKNINHG